MAVKVSELLALPVEERLKLVEVLWESVAECPEALELTGAQKEELDRRLAAYERDVETAFLCSTSSRQPKSASWR